MTATVISLALIHASFGPEAWSQVVPRVAAVSAPVGAPGAAAGAAVSVNGVAPLQLPAAALTASSAFSAAPAAAPMSAVSAAAALTAPAAASEKNEEAAPSAPISAGDVSAPISAGPRTAGVGARVSRIFAQAKDFFSGRKDAGSISANAAPAQDGGRGSESSRPNGLTPAPKGVETGKVSSSGGDNAPPAPSAAPAKAEKGGLFGFSAAVTTLIGGLLVMQVGAEAQGQAMPKLTEEAFGDYSILAVVSIWSQVGSLIGSQLSQPIIKALGLRNTYYGAQFTRAATIGVMIFLLGIGKMPLALMSAFYAANGLVTGILSTADGTMRKYVVGTGDGRQERFRSTYQVLAEIIGFGAPIIFGSVALSASAITAIYPAAIVAAVMLFLAKKVVPADVMAAVNASEAASNQAALAAVKAALNVDAKAALKAFWNKVRALMSTDVRVIRDAIVPHLKEAWLSTKEGAAIVWNDPKLRYSFLVVACGQLQNIMLYRLLSPGFGKLIGGKALMSAIQGLLVGLYSSGGMLTALNNLRVAGQNADKRKAMTKEESAEMDRRSMLNWITLDVVGLLAIMSMALPQSMLGQVVHLPQIMVGFGKWKADLLSWLAPLTLSAAAMIPFGIFQVNAVIKTDSFNTDHLPDDKDKTQKALAFQGSMTTLMSIIAMLALKPQFKVITAAHNPFHGVALAMIPFGVLILYLRHKLAQASDPAGPKSLREIVEASLAKAWNALRPSYGVARAVVDTK